MIDLELSNARLEALAQHMEKQPRKRYNQDVYFSDPRGAYPHCTLPHTFVTDCSTAACIAGHCVIAFPDLVGVSPHAGGCAVKMEGNWMHIEEAATEILGISHEEDRLFSSNNRFDTPQQAALALRNVVKLRRVREDRLESSDVIRAISFAEQNKEV